MGQNTAPDPPRTPRPVVRWGCTAHRTPAGQDCQWCAEQGELFPRTDATRRRSTR